MKPGKVRAFLLLGRAKFWFCWIWALSPCKVRSTGQRFDAESLGNRENVAKFMI